MKRLLLTFALSLFCGLAGIAQEAPTDILFDTTSQDMGRVQIGQTRTVEFEMTALAPAVVILSATTNCECTKAGYPKKPLRKGDKTPIRVSFETRERGYFRKSVHIKYNADGREQMRLLTVTGIVE